MHIKTPDKINFKCARCECAFFIDTARAAAGQEIACPNCGNVFDAKITETIGKASRTLFGVEPVGFTWWIE
jgi:predicted Zn finger-like uncharacterized protein